MSTYILGAGGHAKVVYDAAVLSGIHVDGLAVRDLKEKGFSGLKLISEDEIGSDDNLILGIGDNRTRLTLYNELISINAKVLTVIHPNACVSPSAIIGEGSVVLAGCIVNHSAVCGRCCILNTSSVIEHDCRIESGVHISPGAVLCGGVSVGMESWVGANSVVREYKKIGRGCIIGAGSVVIDDVPDRTKGAGVPFKVI